jgi:hypothetical protein
LTPTLPPASATPFLPVSWQEMVNPEFGVAWLVPKGFFSKRKNAQKSTNWLNW